ncbi:MAG: ATP-binding protein [Acidobacteria bacterium]|nr:ATP-binding protein [Acidobacteriota bacterium]
MPADDAIPPFVGREAELAWLRELWNEATPPGRTGPRLAVLIAETGLGKSRIVQEFYRQLVADPVWNDSGYWPDAFTDATSVAHVNPDLTTHAPPGPPRFLWLGTRWLDVDARNAEARRLAIPDLRERLASHVRTAIHHAPLWNRLRGTYARVLKDHGLAGGLEQVVQEGTGKLFEAATGGLPFGGLLVTLAKAAPSVFAGPDRPVDHAAGVRADAMDAFLDELHEVFGGFGGGGLVLPTVLWLDDAQWADEDTVSVLRRVWERGVERNWPLLIVVTHWEREWRVLGTLDGQSRAASLRRFDDEPGAHTRILEAASEADLDAVLRARLPGLTVLQRQLVLSRAGGNFLTLVENIGELVSQAANFIGRDVGGPLAKAGERRVADWESDRERRVRQRFAALDEQVRDLLGWSSHGGQRFLHEVMARFLAARHGRTDDSVDAQAALDPCVDPLAILSKPSSMFFEFRDVTLHRCAREYFDLYLAEQDEPALVSALRDTLAGWINACYDASGEFAQWGWTEDGEYDESTPLLMRLDVTARREIITRAARDLPIDEEGWDSPVRQAGLRARLWLMDVCAGEHLWREVARVADSLSTLDGHTLTPGVVAPWMLVRAAAYARLAGAGNAERLQDTAIAFAREVAGSDSGAYADALIARGRAIAERAPQDGVRLLEQALDVYDALEGPTGHNVLRVKGALALACVQTGDVAREEQLLRNIVETERIRMLPEDSRRSRALEMLGWLYTRTRRLDDAEPLLEESLAIQRKWEAYDEDMPASRQVDVVSSLVSLAELRQAQHRLSDADTLLQEALTKARRRGDDPGQLLPMWALSLLWGEQRRLDDAITLVDEALEFGRRVLGPTHAQLTKFEELRAELIELRSDDSTSSSGSA